MIEASEKSGKGVSMLPKLPWQLMAKAIIRDRQGRILLLWHPKRNQFFLPGGRLHRLSGNKSNGIPVAGDGTDPHQLGVVLLALIRADKRAKSEMTARALRRRLTQELTTPIKERARPLLKGLTHRHLVVVNLYQPIARAELDRNEVEMEYVYLLADVRFTTPGWLEDLELAVAKQPAIARFFENEEIKAGATSDDIKISPNIYPVLKELGIIKNGTPS